MECAHAGVECNGDHKKAGSRRWIRALEASSMLQRVIGNVISKEEQ